MFYSNALLRPERITPWDILSMFRPCIPSFLRKLYGLV
jgi:hypothetical protein